jgi:hypothetical protein
VASPGLRAEDRAPRRYVASLVWPGRAPHPVNDNRRGWTAGRLVSLAAAAALLVTAAWAVLS